MTTAVQTTTKKKDIRVLLASDHVREQIALALPKHLTPDRMMRVALTTINRTPKLLNCSPESLLSGLMLCSQVGLEPDGRNAHLIPYGDQCQVIFDWKGLVALARRNGVQNIAADTVCENDAFEWYRDGDGLHFKHQVDWRKQRGNVYAAYCIWKDGDQFDGEVMQRDEIEGIRKRSRAGNNGPWVTDWSEMAKKTVVRRSSKKWPLDSEVAGAINADDDTLTEVKSTRPVFGAEKKQLFDVSVQAEPEAPAQVPVETAAVDVQKTDATTTLKETDDQAVARQVKAIKGMLRMKSHSEVELMSFLVEKHGIDDSLGTLADLANGAPAKLADLHDNFAKYAAEMTAWKEEAK